MGAQIGLLYGLFWKWFYGQTTTSHITEPVPTQKIISLFSILFVLAHAGGLFSNSYIEAQDDTIRFLSSSLILLYVSKLFIYLK